MTGIARLGEAVRLWGVLGARAVECQRLGLLDCREVAQLQTGQRVLVTWSGGNGPHEYDVRRCDDGSIDAYFRGAFVGWLDSPIGPWPLTEVRLVADRVVIDEPAYEITFARGPGPTMSPDLIVPAEGEPVPGEWP